MSAVAIQMDCFLLRQGYGGRVVVSQSEPPRNDSLCGDER